MKDKEMINEIKQDFKMHEEQHKQIEEMAKDMGVSFQLAGTTRFGAVAEALIRFGWIKPSKDSVVLTREEYEKLKNRLEYAEKHWELTVNRNQELHDEIKRLDQKRLELQVDNNMLYLQLDNKSKETAEKFYNLSEECGAGVLFWKKVRELAKELGVEIKEEV